MLLLPFSAGAAGMCQIKKTDKLYNRHNVYAFNDKKDKATLRKELESICACESSYPGGPEQPQHYEKDKTTVRYGRVTPNDTGLCQISKTYHEAKSNSMGYDIDTPYGNIKYANYLYRKHGETPWNASSGCH